MKRFLYAIALALVASNAQAVEPYAYLVAPNLSSPTFTGTVTFPDSSTFGSGGLSGTAINSSTLGATTPASAAVTSLTTAGNVTIGGGFTFTSNAFTTLGGSNIAVNAGSAAINISTGTTSGALSMGGASNTTNLSSATINMVNIASSAAALDAMCWNATGGVVTHNAAGALCSVSLRKFKDIMGPITPEQGLDWTLALKPVIAKYNDAQTGTSDHRLHPMFIAEDVEQVSPYLATYSENGDLYGVRYMEMAAVNTAAIQALNLRLDQQQREIYVLVFFVALSFGFHLRRRSR